MQEMIKMEVRNYMNGGSDGLRAVDSRVNQRVEAVVEGWWWSCSGSDGGIRR
ncbi:hypothetical protein Hanom_Chr11g01027441 [Helianthus anomalus]